MGGTARECKYRAGTIGSTHRPRYSDIYGVQTTSSVSCDRMDGVDACELLLDTHLDNSVDRSFYKCRRSTQLDTDLDAAISGNRNALV